MSPHDDRDCRRGLYAGGQIPIGSTARKAADEGGDFFRTGRQRQKGRHGSVLTFKVDCSQRGGGTFPRRSVPIEAFYEPIFSAVNLPPSDSRFFRVAMKLDLRESTNIPEY